MSPFERKLIDAIKSLTVAIKQHAEAMTPACGKATMRNPVAGDYSDPCALPRGHEGDCHP